MFDMIFPLELVLKTNLDLLMETDLNLLNLSEDFINDITFEEKEILLKKKNFLTEQGMSLENILLSQIIYYATWA